MVVGSVVGVADAEEAVGRVMPPVGWMAVVLLRLDTVDTVVCTRERVTVLVTYSVLVMVVVVVDVPVTVVRLALSLLCAAAKAGRMATRTVDRRIVD